MNYMQLNSGPLNITVINNEVTRLDFEAYQGRDNNSMHVQFKETHLLIRNRTVAFKSTYAKFTVKFYPKQYKEGTALFDTRFNEAFSYRKDRDAAVLQNHSNCIRRATPEEIETHWVDPEELKPKT